MAEVINEFPAIAPVTKKSRLWKLADGRIWKIELGMDVDFTKRAASNGSEPGASA